MAPHAVAKLPVLAGFEDWEALFQPGRWAALEQILPNYMRPRRWFSGKARTLAGVHIQAALPLRYAEHTAYITLVQVNYADGGAETYVLPLAYTSLAAATRATMPVHALVAKIADGVLFDPIYDAAFCGALLDIIAAQAQVHTSAGDLLASTSSAFARLRGPLGEVLTPKVSTAEQSNSSIIFGQRLIMKLFRRLEPGLNPDLEIGAFLTDHGNFAHIPPVAGAIEFVQGDTRMTLALLQGFVPNRGDAWYYTLATIAATFGHILARPAEFSLTAGAAPGLFADSALPLPPEANTLLGEFAVSAALLGQRTGEMHLALASDATAPAFAPAPFTQEYQAVLLGSMERRAQQSFALLRTSVERLPPTLQPDAQRLLAREDAVFARLRTALAQPVQAQRSRIHGDYHLGQVLYTGSDFFIIDFEGEPARPLSERRQKGVPLQDVAGMLRSLHYAPYAVLFGQAPGVAFSEDEQAALEPWARAWHRWASAAFFRSYLATVGDAPVLPPPTVLHTLFDAFMLDKAVYELRYELNNRPGWAGIPLEGVLQLIE